MSVLTRDEYKCELGFNADQVARETLLDLVYGHYIFGYSSGWRSGVMDHRTRIANMPLHRRIERYILLRVEGQPLPLWWLFVTRPRQMLHHYWLLLRGNAICPWCGHRAYFFFDKYAVKCYYTGITTPGEVYEDSSFWFEHYRWREMRVRR